MSSWKHSRRSSSMANNSKKNVDARIRQPLENTIEMEKTILPSKTIDIPIDISQQRLFLWINEKYRCTAFRRPGA